MNQDEAPPSTLVRQVSPQDFDDLLRSEMHLEMCLEMRLEQHSWVSSLLSSSLWLDILVPNILAGFLKDPYASSF